MTSCISKIPYPTSQTHHLPIPVKKLWFRREGCMQESVTYALLAGQLEADGCGIRFRVKEYVLSKFCMVGASTCTHAIISPKTLL